MTWWERVVVVIGMMAVLVIAYMILTMFPAGH
jgi:hypothetical protein